jgi:hypothetical protein
LKRFACASFSSALVALLASHCSSGGASGSADAGAPFEAGSGPCPGSAPSGGVPPLHRPGPAQCARTPPSINAGVDAAAPSSCNSDADCTSPGTTTPVCLHHECGVDSCIVDSDCPGPGQACMCAAFATGGSLDTSNKCVPAGCLLDSDCGPEGYCTGNQTYEASSFRCTTPADSCRDPASDCACIDAGVYPYEVCMYAAEVGHFVCGGIYLPG